MTNKQVMKNLLKKQQDEIPAIKSCGESQ